MSPRSPRIYRALLPAFLVLALAFSGQARADKVDTLIQQLGSSTDYKVRLSAALNLAKTGDKRAVPAFVSCLGDSDKTVRGVCATGLGKSVDASVPASQRKKALAKLKIARDKDSSSFVRKQAGKAYETLKQISGAGGGGGRSIYIDVSGIGDKTGKNPTAIRLIERTIKKTLQKQASSMSVAWPGDEALVRGRLNNRRKKSINKFLQAKKVKAFHVSGTITELMATPKGASTIVECKVSMLLATYPDKSMFAFLNGGAKVQASKSARDIKYAKEDCVAAVVEDLVKKKIIPTIKMKAGGL